MKIVSTRAEIKALRAGLDPQLKIGFVPTMGALHEGHLSLVRQAQSSCDQVWASIFVNPLQFGPKEDLSRYPRPFERDVDLLKQAGCNLLFAPKAQEFYASDASTYVTEEAVSAPLTFHRSHHGTVWAIPAVMPAKLPITRTSRDAQFPSAPVRGSCRTASAPVARAWIFRVNDEMVSSQLDEW